MNEALTQARQASATVPVGARERVWRRLQTRPAAATPSWVKGLAFVRACTAAGFAVVSSFSARPAEALICALALSDGFLPGSPGTQTLDPTIPIDYLLQGRTGAVRHALTNTFGFGGSNCSLILGVAA